MKVKYIIAVLMAVACTTGFAQETTTETVQGKTYKIRVPKSKKIDCKLEKYKDRIECKAAPTKMPIIEKPVEKDEQRN